MKRGSTPTHSFILPFDGELASVVEITYSQNREIVLQKYQDDCEISANMVSVTLSQEETFSFVSGVNVEIQIRVKDIAGKVHESSIVCVNCERCLSEEVL